MLVGQHPIPKHQVAVHSPMSTVATCHALVTTYCPSLIKIMKTTPFRLLLTTAAFGVLAALASAASDLQSHQTLRSPEQFKQLKTGDKLAFVCNECKTVTEVAIKSPEDAMELCKEGTTVMCPACKMKAKVTMKNQRNDQPNQTTVVYVNEKGEECLFVAQISDKK